jgi:cytochrome P450
MFLGNLRQMNREGVYFYHRIQKEFGDCVQLSLGHKKIAVFFHPDAVKEILAEKSDVFIKGKQYNQLRKLLGNGLLTSDGNEWQRQRRLLNPIFAKDGLNILQKQIENHCKEFVSKLAPAEVNWSQLMVNFTVTLAVRSFFGPTMNEQDLVIFSKDADTTIRFISKRMTQILPFPILPITNQNQKFLSAKKRIKKVINDFYEAKNNNERGVSKDLLDLLMSARDNESKTQVQLTKNEIDDQIMSFLMASYETTAQSMSWLFYLLAKNPHVQTKLYKELKEKNFKLSDSNDLSSFPYLSAVINETLRLYPAGWIIARDVQSDATVGKYQIKKNTIIAVCPYVTQRDERFFKNPEEFNPERFLNSEDLELMIRGAFIPFSLGKRSCIGARFALLEMAHFCLEFLKAFIIESDGKEMSVKGFVTLKSAQPISLKIKRRD